MQLLIYVPASYTNYRSTVIIDFNDLVKTKLLLSRAKLSDTFVFAIKILHWILYHHLIHT